MDMSVIKVTAKGQIAIPASIRASAKIKEGDTLLIVEHHGKLLLEKTEHITKALGDDLKDIIQFTELSLKKVWENREDEIWERYRKK